MKAVKFGQKFICFSFVIEDGKHVVNISEVCWRLLRLGTKLVYSLVFPVVTYGNESWIYLRRTSGH